MGAHCELSFPTVNIMLNDLNLKGKFMYRKHDAHYMISLLRKGYLRLGTSRFIETVGIFSLDKFDAAFDAAAVMAS